MDPLLFAPSRPDDDHPIPEGASSCEWRELKPRPWAFGVQLSIAIPFGTTTPNGVQAAPSLGGVSAETISAGQRQARADAAQERASRKRNLRDDHECRPRRPPWRCRHRQRRDALVGGVVRRDFI